MDYYDPSIAWSLFTSARTYTLIEEHPVGEERNVSLDLSLSFGYTSPATDKEKNSQVGDSNCNSDHYQRQQLKIKNCREKNSSEGSSLEPGDVSLELSLSWGNGRMSKGKGKSPETDKQKESRFDVRERSRQYQIREEHNVNNCPEVGGLLNLGFDDTRTSKKRERMEDPSNTRKDSSSRNKRNKVEREEKSEEFVTELRLGHDPWCIKKQLTESDLGSMTRLLLAAELVKSHVFPLWNADQLAKIKEKEGLPVSVYDCDTRTEHNLAFKQWKKTNVLVNNWVNGFVKRRELKVGDEIGLYWDRSSSRFKFSVLNRAARS
ncbi:hypothetical protein DITRI_Ditri01bG0120200 [Diplodiscus trichospermus]